MLSGVHVVLNLFGFAHNTGGSSGSLQAPGLREDARALCKEAACSGEDGTRARGLSFHIASAQKQAVKS